MRRIHSILAALLVTILIVAGPCPACPSPAPEKSAHDCCPGGKTTKQAPSPDDCPLIAYYLDVTQHGKSNQEALAMLATAPAPADQFAALPMPGAMAVSSPTADGTNARYRYLLHTVLLI